MKYSDGRGIKAQRWDQNVIARSDDFNGIGFNQYKNLTDMLATMIREGEETVDYPNEFLNHVVSGLTIRPDNLLTLTLHSGVAVSFQGNYVDTNDAWGFTADPQSAFSVVVPEDTQIAMPAAPTTGDRVDLIEVRPILTAYDAKARNFKDPITGSISSSIVNTQYEVGFEFQITPGDFDGDDRECTVTFVDESAGNYNGAYIYFETQRFNPGSSVIPNENTTFTVAFTYDASTAVAGPHGELGSSPYQLAIVHVDTGETATSIAQKVEAAINDRIAYQATVGDLSNYSYYSRDLVFRSASESAGVLTVFMNNGQFGQVGNNQASAPMTYTNVSNGSSVFFPNYTSGWIPLAQVWRKKDETSIDAWQIWDHRVSPMWGWQPNSVVSWRDRHVAKALKTDVLNFTDQASYVRTSLRMIVEDSFTSPLSNKLSHLADDFNLRSITLEMVRNSLFDSIKSFRPRNTTANNPAIVRSMNGLLFSIANANNVGVSDDFGENWTSETSGTAAAIANATAESGNLLVMVSSTGGIVTRNDGVPGSGVWNTYLPVANPLSDVNFFPSNNEWTAVGTAGTILFSTNGSTWFNLTVGANDLKGVTSTISRFVIVGDAGTILRGETGSWATVATGATVNFTGVKWLGNHLSRVYAWGGSEMWVSTSTASTWEKMVMPFPSTVTISDVAEMQVNGPEGDSTYLIVQTNSGVFYGLEDGGDIYWRGNTQGQKSVVVSDASGDVTMFLSVTAGSQPFTVPNAGFGNYSFDMENFELFALPGLGGASGWSDMIADGKTVVALKTLASGVPQALISPFYGG